MKAKTFGSSLVRVVILLICVTMPPPPTRGQNTHDDGQDHAHETDDHRSSDGPHEDDLLRLDPAVLEEFGIVIERAQSGELRTSLRLAGEVVFNADQVAHVTPSVSGMVLEVRKSVGDPVEAGEVMAVLICRELAEARSAFLAAKARLALAEANLKRDERLLADRVGTERQALESAQTVQETRIGLNLAEQTLHALGQSQDDVDALESAPDTSLGRYELKAPLTGVVTTRELTRGEVVSAQPDLPPFIVADVSRVWINLIVHPRDLPRVREGLSVIIEFRHDLPDAAGTIAFISPAVDERTRTATARVVLENPDGRWRPGLFITGQVALDESARATVVVPRAALQTVDDQTVVFIRADEGLAPRPVRTGRSDRTHVEIVEGLQAGDHYVAANAFALIAELGRASLEHAGHAH